MTRLSDKLREIERHVDSGEVHAARLLLLDALRATRLPAQARLKLANLARRAHMPRKAVALLHRVVRPAGGTRQGGSIAERAEYAASLAAIGAPKEAQQILEELPGERHPDVWLFRAYAAIYQWDWAASIEPLEKYLRAPSLEGDSRQWARVFLANSLTRGPGNYARARELLSQVLKETGPDRYRMAYKNALLNSLQNEVLRGAWKPAHALSARIDQEGLCDSDPLYTLVVEQWNATRDLLEAKPSSRSLPARRLKRIIAAYRHDGLFENARGADYYLARGTGDRELLLKLAFGTPHAAFKEQALSEAKKLAPGRAIPACFDWILGGGGRPGPELLIEASDGRTPLSPQAYLKPGFLPQRLFAALASDFYKPLQITELHEAVCPGECYLPGATPDRIRQLILRLRLWFKQEKLPLRVVERQGAYGLEAVSPICVRVRAEASQTSSLSPRALAGLSALRQAFATAPFSAGEAAKALGMPLRSAIRSLNEALGAGKISRTGQARATRYRLGS